MGAKRKAVHWPRPRRRRRLIHSRRSAAAVQCNGGLSGVFDFLDVEPESSTGEVRLQEGLESDTPASLVGDLEAELHQAAARAGLQAMADTVVGQRFHDGVSIPHVFIGRPPVIERD
jgi:hypothetical protein